MSAMLGLKPVEDAIKKGCTSDPLALSNNTSPCLDLQEVFQQSNAGSCQQGFQYAWILTLGDTIAIHPEASADGAVAGASAALVVGPWWCPGKTTICWMPFGPSGSRVLEVLSLIAVFAPPPRTSNKQTTNNQLQQEQQPADCNLIFVTSQIALERLPTNRHFASSVKCPSTRRP